TPRGKIPDNLGPTCRSGLRFPGGQYDFGSGRETMSGRLCGVLIVLSAMACGPAPAQGVPQGKAQFTEYVAAPLRSELKDVAVVVKGPLTLALGDGNMQANLDRIFTYCGSDAKGCPREIANYVKGVAEAVRGERAPPSKEAIRILVRPRAYAEGSPELKN